MTGVLSSSLTLQTLVFMCCSAIIMEGKQKGWHKGFWFLRPESLARNHNTANPCTHEEPNCVVHIMRGMRNYCLIGLALDMFKALVSCTRSGQWNLSHFSMESVFWLVCYIGIYRVSHCYLMRNEDNRLEQKHLLASFLAGLSFICYPKRTILSFGLLEAIRCLWAKFKPTFKCGYGWSDVLFPMILAFLIHNYVLDPSSVSGLATAIINNTTANYALNINKRLLQLQLTNGQQT
ncbi:transmembrane protein 135-like [Drosophila tropicalis]|uniref:transmembrane protein 135-like n=1 Tax=Drosophila tropicalis TaxID=46794 RepID=UPI0035AC122A